jgi:hypothetical protein
MPRLAGGWRAAGARADQFGIRNGEQCEGKGQGAEQGAAGAGVLVAGAGVLARAAC